MWLDRSGADAYRATAQWLVGLLPLAGLLGAAVTVGPSLLASGGGSGWTTSLLDHGRQLGWLAVGLVGVGIVVRAAGSLLVVQPPEADELLGAVADGQPDRVRAAASAGALVPYYVDVDSYREDLARLSARQPVDGDTDRTTPLPATEAMLDRVAGATEQLVARIHREDVESGFRRMLPRLALGGALLVLGLIMAGATAPVAPDAVSGGTAVAIALGPGAADDLATTTGCATQDLDALTYTAVGGTWQRPFVVVQGPGCDFGATWHPAAGTVVASVAED